MDGLRRALNLHPEIFTKEEIRKIEFNEWKQEFVRREQEAGIDESCRKLLTSGKLPERTP